MARPQPHGQCLNVGVDNFGNSCLLLLLGHVVGKLLIDQQALAGAQVAPKLFADEGKEGVNHLEQFGIDMSQRLCCVNARIPARKRD